MTATAPATTHKPVTYEEYLEEFLNEPPSRQPYYIVDGVRFMPPSPRPIHQRIVHRLEVLLDAFEQSPVAIRILPAPMDVVIRRAPLRTRQPDILIMSTEHYREASIDDLEGPITIAPELVIEVLSPSETRRSVGDKLADFQAIGVRECWIVSSEAETVEVLALSTDEVRTAAVYGQNQEAQSLVFADLMVPVARIFER
jgi:Uma2 family endonuclease